MARQMLFDIALTLGIHPSAFGSRSEPGGRVMVPRRLGLNIHVVTDILQWLTLRDEPNEDNAINLTETLRFGNSWADLPPLILSMRMNPGKVDAVVVAEHRNLQSILSSYKILNRTLDRVILVLVRCYGFAGKIIAN